MTRWTGELPGGPPRSGQRIALEPNQDLLLDGHGAWVVAGGDLAVFAIVRGDDGAIGPRRHLFDVRQSEAAFAVPDLARGAYTLVATALSPTRLVYASDDDLATEDGRLLLDAWVAALGRTIAAHFPPPPEARPTTVGDVRLRPGEALRSAAAGPLWVRLDEGEVRLQGIAELTWRAEDGPLLLGPRLAVTAPAGARVIVGPPDARMAAAGRLGLHALFARALPAWSRAEDADQLVRIAARARRDQEAAATAMAALAGALDATVVVPAADGPPALGACRLVAEALGTTVKAPVPDELARTADPVLAIARASRLRRRRVALPPGWWLADAGPLVGELRDGGGHVALLPARGGYEVVEPRSGRRRAVDASVAAELEPFATTLYRPFAAGTKTAREVARFALRGRWKDLALLFLAGGAVAALGMLTPLATGLLIDQAIPDADRLLLLQTGAVLAATAVGAAAFQAMLALATQRLEGHADAATQAAIWDRLLDLPAPFFRRFTVGELEHRVQAVGQIRRILAGLALKTALSGVFALSNLALMGWASPALAAIAAAVAGVLAALTGLAGWMKLRRAKPLRPTEGALRGLVVGLVQGVPKLRVAGAEARAFAHWARLFQAREASQRGVVAIDAAAESFNAVAPLLASLAVFWAAATLGGLQIQGQGGLSTGTFLMFAMSFSVFMRGATDLSTGLVALLDVEPAWGRARPILEQRPEDPGGGEHPDVLTGRVALERVTFRYLPGGRTVLQDVTIAVEPGQHVAIVGPSGGGKSTLVRLLLGFEQPESGRVTYDGRDLARLDKRAVRRQLGVVLQGGQVLAGSIFDNIACGAPLTVDEAQEAARHAGLEPDLAALPMGLHTMVSEGGTNLSGGQRQRLLIARALASRPRVVIFDEATSALDNGTQAIVAASLAELGATRIVIAHRLSTIRKADRIYVIDGGRVVQEGTYEELAGHEGLFARSIARQLL